MHYSKKAKKILGKELALICICEYYHGADNGYVCAIKILQTFSLANFIII